MEKVYILYEGDECLSMDSLRLKGVFSDIEHLKVGARKLIEQRAKKYLAHARECSGYDEDTTTKDVVEDIMIELFSRGSICGWGVNYTYEWVTLDEVQD